jgi:predicted HTH transcriptional regulator
MRVFKDIGLVEQLGTGIRRILKYYNEDVYDIYPNFIKVSFKYRNKEDIALKNKHAHNLNEVQRDIISIVLNNPNVTQELIALELSISKRTVIRHMNTLVNMGVLKRVGGNRTGYWLVTKIE